MTQDLMITKKRGELEQVDKWQGVFSNYTHPQLEDFIKDVIKSNRDSLPTEASQRLVREFFLYGFMKATGQKFKFSTERDYTEEKWDEKGVFGTNNGVLAVADFEGRDLKSSAQQRRDC